jgi:hypothetical protein
MKKATTTLLLTALFALTRAAVAQNDLKSDPAYLPIDESIDVKIAQPEVTVNLPRFLLLNALSEFNGGADDPFAQAGIDIGEIVKDIKLIRVMVIEAKDGNQEHVAAGVKKLRTQLESGWVSIVAVPEEGVGIYAKGDPGGQSVAGLAILISDGDDTIVGNVVGNVPIGKLTKIASKLGANNPQLKKLLEQLMGAGAGGNQESPAKPKE